MLLVNVFVVVSVSAMAGAYLGPWVSMPVQDEGLACPPDWQVFGHSCFFPCRAQQGITWQDARGMCQNLGGKMAAPQSSEENSFFGTLLQDETLWIACRVNNTVRVWVCDGREPGTLTDFRGWDIDDRPESSPDDCAAMREDRGEISWIKKSCDQRLDGAVCVRPFNRVSGPCRQHRRIRQDTDIKLKSISPHGSKTPGLPPCLTGHVIGEFAVRGVSGCAARCIAQPECLSFNILFQAEELMCQLNNSTGLDNSGASYTEADNCILYHME